jgi:hypothetical protein
MNQFNKTHQTSSDYSEKGISNYTLGLTKIAKECRTLEKELTWMDESHEKQSLEKFIFGKDCLLKQDKEHLLEDKAKLSKLLQNAVSEKEAAFRAFVQIENLSQKLLNNIKAMKKKIRNKQLMMNSLGKKGINCSTIRSIYHLDRKAREMA